MGISVAEFFARADALPFADLSTLIGEGGALIVAPHPDDESLGCGGLLALCAEANRAAHVAIVSDGTGSHPNSKAYPYDALRELREREAVAAVSALGLPSGQLTFLRLRDRFVPPDGAEAEAAIGQLVEMARAIDASAVFVTWRHDPHGDHQASFRLAREAARRAGNLQLFEYPIWGHTLAADVEIEVEPRGRRLDISAVLHRKLAAIAAHRSQVTPMIEDDPDGVMLSREMIARFERPFEVFLEEA